MNLVVNPEALRNLSSRIKGIADDFNECLTKVKNDNSELQNAWVGSDINSYTNTINEQQAAMDSLYTTLTEICNTMNEIANTYESVQDDLAAAAGGNN